MSSGAGSRISRGNIPYTIMGTVAFFLSITQYSVYLTQSLVVFLGERIFILCMFLVVPLGLANFSPRSRGGTRPNSAGA